MKKHTFLFVLLLSVSYSASSQIKEIKIPTVEFRQGIYYVELNGNTAYERGFQHGRALAFVIKRSLKNFENWIEDNTTIKVPKEAISDFATGKGYIQSVKDQLPC